MSCSGRRLTHGVSVRPISIRMTTTTTTAFVTPMMNNKYDNLAVLERLRAGDEEALADAFSEYRACLRRLVSFLIRRLATNASPGNATDEFFELSLINDGYRSGHRSRKWFTFGISSARQPFIKSVGAITSAVTAINVDQDYLCVGKVLVTHDQVTTALRVYHWSESIDVDEPTAWTTLGSTGRCELRVVGIRLSAATDAEYDIDELKIGTTWQSVTSSSVD